jgi:hypothetical protein
MNTLDQTDNTNIFGLLKGPSGAGKSVAALSFPDPYVFDLDHKMPAIARKHFPKKSVEYDTYEDIDPLSAKITGWLESNDCPYETLIYDSITSLVRIIMNSIAKAKGESTPQMLKMMKATRSGKQMAELMGYDYYNAEVRFIDWILSANKILFTRPGNPKNILFTAHIVEIRTKPDINTKLVTVTRSIMTLGNKAPAIVPTEFDECWMFGTQETGGTGPNDPAEIRHVMCTQTEGEDDAKTAFRLSRHTDFTNGNLYELLMSQIRGSEMFI